MCKSPQTVIVIKYNVILFSYPCKSYGSALPLHIFCLLGYSVLSEAGGINGGYIIKAVKGLQRLSLVKQCLAFLINVQDGGSIQIRISAVFDDDKFSGEISGSSTRRR